MLGLPPAAANVSSHISSPYITEYIIPTSDSRPLAITTDESGYVWFVETDAANLARFDPETEAFTEYKIPTEISRRVEAWDILADGKGGIWFTDATGHLIWKFNVAKSSFEAYPIESRDVFNGHTFRPYPLRLALDADGNIWFTELHGNRIGRLDPLLAIPGTSKGIVEFELPTKRSRKSPMGSGAAGIAIDSNGVIWITESFSSFTGDAKIASFDPNVNRFVEYSLPRSINSPVGIAISENGDLWIADHGSSMLIQFNQHTGVAREYPTSKPSDFSISLPYWILIDEKGHLWFNEHAGNKIARLQPEEQILVEYHIPTGPLANVLDLAIDNQGNVWFTELTENKIGVIRASSPLPYESKAVPNTLQIAPGESASISMMIISTAAKTSTLELSISSSFTPSGSLRNMTVIYDQGTIQLETARSREVLLMIESEQFLVPGNYTLTLSTSAEFLTFSSFVKVSVVEVTQTLDLGLPHVFPFVVGTGIYLGVTILALAAVVTIFLWRRRQTTTR